jgi:hypothetical protein
VRTLRSGQVQLAYRGAKLRWKELPGRPQRLAAKPAAQDPWRKDGVGLGKRYWNAQKAKGDILS